MADEPEKPERPTSFAKTIDGDAREPARRLKKEFERATAPRKTSLERGTTDTKAPQPQRTTSVAKTAVPLEASPPLKQDFDRAKAPRRTPLERRAEKAEAVGLQRTTSAAQSIDPDPARASKLKKQFDRATEAAESVGEQQGRARSGRTVTARHDPDAKAEPRPTGLEASIADRQAFGARQAKLARAEAAMQRVAEQNRRMQERQRDRGHGR